MERNGFQLTHLHASRFLNSLIQIILMTNLILNETIIRWELRRTMEDLQALDRQLHTCIYDRLDHIFGWVRSHIWLGLVTYLIGFAHIFDWVWSHI